MELSVINRLPGVVVSAVAVRQDIMLARVGGGVVGGQLSAMSVFWWWSRVVELCDSVVTDRSLQGCI